MDKVRSMPTVLCGCGNEYIDMTTDLRSAILRCLGVESEGHALSIDGNCEKPTSSRAAQGPRADLIVSGRLTWIAARPGSFLPQKSCGPRRINRTGCSVRGDVFVRAAAAINVPGRASWRRPLELRLHESGSRAEADSGHMPV